MLRQLDIHEKIILNPYLTLYIKTNLKWITHLNTKSKTIKILEENISENLCNLGVLKDGLDKTQKEKSVKEKKGPHQNLNLLKKIKR